ncbi:MAG: hypothetical protein GY757_52615 [bacterium]|nr:hypothetical protein [bacterium]
MPGGKKKCQARMIRFEIKDGRRIEYPQFPEDAYREAIVNAVIHRDYFENGEVAVEKLKNSILINNPGGSKGDSRATPALGPRRAAGFIFARNSTKKKRKIRLTGMVLDVELFPGLYQQVVYFCFVRVIL